MPSTLQASERLRQCLSRIEQLDARINAWEYVDAAGALAAARSLDEQAAAGQPLGILHGMPIGVKDIIDVAGLPTKAGSPLRADYVATDDAPVVANLRAAGAVILGKTVTCEFACFDPSRTANPWNLAHTPGGSSSGSAAAVAAGMCMAAIGTQTGGSIIRPAAYCGAIGFKPTFEAISRAGVVPVSSHLDHVGCFARNVAIVMRMAAAMRGDFGSSIRSPHASPPRLGLLAGFFEERADASVRRMTHAAIGRLRDAGATIERVAPPFDMPEVIRHHRAIMAFDAAEYHHTAFAEHPAAYGPQISALLREGLAITRDEYEAALEFQRRFVATTAGMFARFDAIVTPAAPSVAPSRRDTTGDPSFNVAWSLAGVPAVCLPCALDEAGMPAALQLAGPRDGDDALLSVAQWCEGPLGFAKVPSIVGPAFQPDML